MALNNGSTTAHRGLTWAVAAAVGVIAWIVFHQATRGAMLQWDDDINLQGNIHVQALSAGNLRWMFTDSSYVRRYVPLGWLALALDYRLFGPGAHSFHVMNLALHCTDAALVFFLILRLARMVPECSSWSGGRPGIAAAAAGSLLWALHPLRVEAVARASGMYCQAALFLLLSFLAYLESAASKPGTRARRLALAASVLAFAMSLTSYPLALGYAGVLVVVDVLVLRRISVAPGLLKGAGNRGVWMEKIPFVAVTAAVLCITMAARFRAAGLWEPPPTLAQFGLVSRGLQACYIWAYYVWKPFAPFHLSPVYTTLVWFDPADPRFLGSAVAVAAISALLLWRRRAWPKTLALWCCHLILLVPVLGLTEHPHYANDRYNYLVAIPASVALTAVLMRAWRAGIWRIPAFACAFAAIAFCCRASAAQVGIWRDSETLFRHMLAELGPDPYRADILRRLGTLFGREGRRAEAVAAYEEAVRAAPNWAIGRHELGMALVAAGETENGIAELQVALRIDPGMQDARYDLAEALFKAGRVPEAIEAIQELLRAKPSVAAYYDLSVMFGREGRLGDAMRACDEALGIEPANPQALALKRVLAAAGAK